MKKDLSAAVTQEENWFVAQWLEVDVASQGRSEKEALDNLRDALRFHFTPPVRLRSILRQAGLTESEFAKL